MKRRCANVYFNNSNMFVCNQLFIIPLHAARRAMAAAPPAVLEVEDGITELLLQHGHMEYHCIEILHRYRYVE